MITIQEQIMVLLTSNDPVFWSWGVDSVNYIPDGVRLSVNGFRHDQFVDVVLNRGADLYEIHLRDKELKVVESETRIYADMLLETLDRLVESGVENYEQKAADIARGINF